MGCGGRPFGEEPHYLSAHPLRRRVHFHDGGPPCRGVEAPGDSLRLPGVTCDEWELRIPWLRAHQVRRRSSDEPRGVGVVTPRPKGRKNFGGLGSGDLVKGARLPKRR